MEENQNKKRILISGKETKNVSSLKRVLEDSDFTVSIPPNSIETANRISEKMPHLIIVNLENIENGELKLCEVLRSNPVSYKIPFIFLTPRDIYGDLVPKFTTSSDRFVLKPFNFYMVLSFARQILSDLDKAEILSSAYEKTIKGDLAQIPLADLIQIFLLNKKSGLLTISHKPLIARIHFYKGSIVSASVANIKGTKAVFRLMGLKNGSFEFTPNEKPESINVTMNTEGLLLEGMRQIDEVNNIKESFPALNTKVVMNNNCDTSDLKNSEILSDILKVSRVPVSINEIIDSLKFCDLEIYEGLNVLFSNDILIPYETKDKDGAQHLDPIVKKEEIFQLRKYFKKISLTEEEIVTAKILIISGSPELEKGFTRSLSLGFKEFDLNRKIFGIEGIFGNSGNFRITEGAFLSLFAFPVDKEYSPLWELLSFDRIGTIVLMEFSSSSLYSELIDVTRFLSKNKTFPVLYAVNNSPYDTEQTFEILKKDFSVSSMDDIVPFMTDDPLSVKAVIRKIIEKIIK